MADINHRLAGSLVSLATNPPSSNSWTTTGNTHTITNAHIEADSVLLIVWTSANGVQAGEIVQVAAAGSCALTTTNSVPSGTTFKYIIL